MPKDCSPSQEVSHHHKLQNNIYYFLRCVWQLPSNRTKSWFVAWHGCVMTFAFSYLFVHFYFIVRLLLLSFLIQKVLFHKRIIIIQVHFFYYTIRLFFFSTFFVHVLVYQSFRELSNKDTPWFMFLNKITELYQSF